jgi:hypothetical protein
MSIESLLKAVTEVAVIISPLILNLLISLVLIFVTIIIAKFIQSLVTSLLKSALLDKGLQAIGFNQILTKGDIKKTPSELIGDLVYWLVVFITVTSVILVFGPKNSSALLSTVLTYSISVFGAVFILGIAIFLSTFIASLVTVVGGNLGLSNTKLLAKIAQYGVTIFGFLKALEVFGIGPDIIVASFSVIVGAVGLAFAIAFGLGCKDAAGDFLATLFKGK